jgi:RNA polymerase sigma-70 factor, ECF subfamily
MNAGAQCQVDKDIPLREQTMDLDNPARWQALYEENGKSIYYLALRMLNDSALAEDATHDVFLKAFRSRAGFRGSSKIKTWLYRIAANHCMNLTGSWHSRNVSSGIEDDFMDNAAVSSETPLRILEAKELGEQIQQTLDALPEEYSVILLLAADEELSYEEIASLLDQSPDAIRGKLYRARKAFAIEFRKRERGIS